MQKGDAGRHLQEVTEMLAATTLAELRSVLEGLPASSPRGVARVALVPTMGALHAGHLALLAAAHEAAEFVVASIFVNPLQFERAEDLARYPRDDAADLASLADAGCHLAWMPTVEVMYPGQDATTIEVAGPALGWEGDARPGHFRGVATVVAKLFAQVRPEVALFGEKDWQQLQVIRRMVADLVIPVRIEGIATLREPDGLAMSSRNRFLTQGERQVAPLLFTTLSDLADALAAGRAADVASAQARAALAAAGFAVEYLALVDGISMRATNHPGCGTRLVAAARLGAVRLLDNVATRAASR